MPKKTELSPASRVQMILLEVKHLRPEWAYDFGAIIAANLTKAGIAISEESVLEALAEMETRMPKAFLSDAELEFINLSEVKRPTLPGFKRRRAIAAESPAYYMNAQQRLAKKKKEALNEEAPAAFLAHVLYIIEKASQTPGYPVGRIERHRRADVAEKLWRVERRMLGHDELIARLEDLIQEDPTLTQAVPKIKESAS